MAYHDCGCGMWDNKFFLRPRSIELHVGTWRHVFYLNYLLLTTSQRNVFMNQDED